MAGFCVSWMCNIPSLVPYLRDHKHLASLHHISLFEHFNWVNVILHEIMQGREGKRIIQLMSNELKMTDSSVFTYWLRSRTPNSYLRKEEPWRCTTFPTEHPRVLHPCIGSIQGDIRRPFTNNFARHSVNDEKARERLQEASFADLATELEGQGVARVDSGSKRIKDRRY